MRVLFVYFNLGYCVTMLSLIDVKIKRKMSMIRTVKRLQEAYETFGSIKKLT